MEKSEFQNKHVFLPIALAVIGFVFSIFAITTNQVYFEYQNGIMKIIIFSLFTLSIYLYSRVSRRMFDSVKAISNLLQFFF
jgi:hypothetical protein